MTKILDTISFLFSVPGLTVGLLDMPGFEHFQVNGFEQLCINVANERVQRFFTSHIFVHERIESERDGLKLDNVNYSHNQELVDVFLAVSIGSD